MKSIILAVLFISNICDAFIYSPILRPSHKTIIYKSSLTNMNMVSPNKNSSTFNMFNDYIYTRNATNIKKINNLNKDNKNKVKKNDNNVEEYADENEKFFASRHMFGLSDYDLIILRISTYIVITWYCIIMWILDIVKHF